MNPQEIEYIECPDCDGKRERPDFFGDMKCCPTCSGEGFVDADNYETEYDIRESIATGN